MHIKGIKMLFWHHSAKRRIKTAQRFFKIFIRLPYAVVEASTSVCISGVIIMMAEKNYNGSQV